MQYLPRHPPMIQHTLHIVNTCFCHNCISNWCTINPVCPVCRGVLGDGDIAVLRGHLLQVYESLTLTCKDCMANLNIRNAKLHRLHCEKMKTAKIYQPRPRQPIRDVSAKHVPYENEKWAAHGQPMCCTWAAH